MRNSVALDVKNLVLGIEIADVETAESFSPAFQASASGYISIFEAQVFQEFERRKSRFVAQKALQNVIVRGELSYYAFAEVFLLLDFLVVEGVLASQTAKLLVPAAADRGAAIQAVTCFFNVEHTGLDKHSQAKEREFAHKVKDIKERCLRNGRIFAAKFYFACN